MPLSKAQAAEVAERRAKLVKLRRQGVPFDDPRIQALGYSSRQHASKDLIRALESNRADEQAEVSVYRQQENERLDALLEAAWPRATSPSPIFDKDGIVVGEGIDFKAVDVVLKLMDRRAKLNGLDMPVRTELSGPGGGAMRLDSASLAELNHLIATAGDPDPDDPDVDEDLGEAYVDEDDDDDEA